ncbi:coiled-coil protein [Methanococcoides methylutens]|uniref:coiled-coil protein n=1 Tax=Methanococcoides methylutens TaxID=2226 RepID=UPI004045097C
MSDLPDATTMTERDLKNVVNDYRTKISQNERTLKAVFRDLKLHRTNIDELKEKRDKLNAQVKELALKAREEKRLRDAVNEKIAEIKASNEKIRGEKDKVTGSISELKAKRDEYNKLSRGSVDSLTKAYAAELDKFLNADIPLKHEIDIFGKLTDLQQRIDSASTADDIHKKIVETYKQSESIYKSDGTVGGNIKDLAEESQKHHLAMLDSYKKVDELRKEADMYHSQIKETYDVVAPIREKIDPLKVKISQLRDELSIYLDKLNDIQLEKDEKKVDEQHIVAKEKFEKTGKMSLQDLKLLMEKGDIKF